jgi:hypothetical protein
MAMRRQFALSLFFIFVELTTADYVVENNVNHQWISNNCDTYDQSKLFGAIQTSIRHSYRDLYYSLESSWMQRFFHGQSKVSIECVELNGLDKADRVKRTKPLTIDEDILQIIYASASSEYHYIAHNISNPIDNFLTFNPCWLILVSFSAQVYRLIMNDALINSSYFLLARPPNRIIT